MKNWFKYLKQNTDAVMTLFSSILFFIILPIFIYFYDVYYFGLYAIFAWLAIFAVGISIQDSIKKYKQFVKKQQNLYK